MEELRRLENVQRILRFMESRGMVNSSASSDHQSNRFIANFILFLIEPCLGLEMDRKCSLIAEHLPRISAALLEEEPLYLSEGNRKILDNDCSGYPQNFAENSLQVEFDEKTSYSLLHTTGTNLAVIGLHSMLQANSTLEDFCRSYYMFHGLDVSSPSSIFKYLPILSFTESFIYQLDKMNEEFVLISANCESDLGGESEKATEVLVTRFPTDPFKPLLALLESKCLVNERIREEFRHGEEYWALERKLCLTSKSKEQILVEDVMSAIHLKSFDFRVLNLLLYQLRGEEVDDLHLEFLSVSEFLVEVSDDLFDYEDDVLENNFNILRMFIKIYGASAAPSMLAKCISDAEEKYNNLLESLDPHLRLSYQRRCEEATREGGKISGNPLGTWTIPNLIVDEDSYRSNMNHDRT